MKIVALSDSHSRHTSLTAPLPKGDILVHAGDLTNYGWNYEVEKFLDWFQKLDYPLKILVPGNHDFYFQDEPLIVKRMCSERNIHLLINEKLIYEGVTFYGSPFTPYVGLEWAFLKDRGDSIMEEWKKIPNSTNVLVTHGPCFGILDRGGRFNSHLGCEDLRKRVLEVRPQVHIFGHIHESFGWEECQGIGFYNVSVCNGKNELVNPVTEISI